MHDDKRVSPSYKKDTLSNQLTCDASSHSDGSDGSSTRHTTSAQINIFIFISPTGSSIKEKKKNLIK